jgi:hypothetical protein
MHPTLRCDPVRGATHRRLTPHDRMMARAGRTPSRTSRSTNGCAGRGVAVWQSRRPTASDGETRLFTPGSAILLEDTTGQGHSSRTVDGEVLIAVTQLGD